MVVLEAETKEEVVVVTMLSFLALLALAVGRNPYFCFSFVRFCVRVPHSLWPYYTIRGIQYLGGSRIIFIFFQKVFYELMMRCWRDVHR